MAKLKQAFKRKEKKYILTKENYEGLRKALAGHMIEDDYGLHTISSVYYDTENFELIRHSLEKPMYREKFRLRAYGKLQVKDKVFLEIKKKCQGIVYKRRIGLAYQDVSAYLTNQQKLKSKKLVDQQISQEITWLVRQKQLVPKVMIAYDRRALFDPTDDSFRVTFDFNIRWRTTNLDLTKGAEGQLVAPEIAVLMEVKALGAYPLWFADILAKLEIYPSSFTKYGQTYKRYLYHEEDFKDVI
ncbi:VTC domain-containing protein [Vagococcus salmoninarum]|uniref:Molecular chaperone n=1 Tax=Vagococcus salmoninarum TaxID=2739 RepID=A0A429ZVZ2_9ENTE|nr:polyphosphate polymerase domain-containing protein [Vagococcus salmoninarum]RST97924.1 molecular chaperone [Vagococcus salmoninarum]